MFEDILELEGLVPTAICYVVITVMMWYIFNYWGTTGMEIGWIKRIMFHIVLIPLTYFIVVYYKNKE